MHRLGRSWPVNSLFYLFAACFLVAVFPVRAQQCPPGYIPIGGQQAGWVDCVPSNGPSAEPPYTGPLWETRWGVIATTDGAFGAVSGYSSKRKAIRAATKQCKANGGKNCKVQLSFYNQCGALAWGDGYSSAVSAPQKQQAEEMAVNNCSQRAQNCTLYYSACNYPERVQ